MSGTTSSSDSSGQSTYEAAKGAIGSVAEQARAAAPSAYDAAARGTKYVSSTVSEHPIVTVLATAGLVYLLGRLARPSDDDTSVWQGLPRFGGELRAWDQGVGFDVILSSCFEPFFGSAPGGAILPSRPARWCGCRAQRRSRTAPSWGRPEGLSLTGASTAAG